MRRRVISLISEKEKTGMTDKDVFKKNRNFYIGIAGTVGEGLLSGSLFLLLYTVMRLLWSGTFDLSRALKVTGLIAVIFFFRIVIYSFGYTRALRQHSFLTADCC